MSMNVGIIMGRLTADPELRTTQSNKSVVSFTVAVDRMYSQNATDFIPVVAWNEAANFIANNFTKGKMIAITGSYQSRSYEDKQGNKRNVIELVANKVSFCGDKVKAEAQTEAPVIDEDLPF